MLIDRPYDIAFVTYGLQAGGTERVVSTLAGAWADSGKRVCVITFDADKDFYALPGSVGRYSINLPYQTHAKLRGIAATIKRIARLRTALTLAAAPVVLSFLPVPNIVSILATWNLGVRLIISERNDPQQQILPWPWETLRKRLYRYPAAVVANSRGAAGYMRAYVPEEKIRYIPNPMGVTRSNNRAACAGPTILTLGRLTYQKAHDILIAAFARIATEYPRWRLTIIGQGNLREQLLEQARTLGIHERIDWLGAVADPFPYYRAAEIFVMPSRFEGMPNALLEAMSCGIPAIVSDASPGPLEYIEHASTGLVVPVDDHVALAQALQQLIKQPDLRKTLGRAGQRRLAANRLEDVIRQWENVSGMNTFPSKSR